MIIFDFTFWIFASELLFIVMLWLFITELNNDFGSEEDFERLINSRIFVQISSRSN